MCGRFTFTADEKALAERFGVKLPAKLVSPARYNIAPTQNVLTVSENGALEVTAMRWGMIPSWAKDPSIGNRIINARAETLMVKPSFQSAIRHRRCLVLADGFYEWQKRGPDKQPVRIVLKTRELFGFAGLWDRWRSPEGVEIQSCTIITTQANDLLRVVHDRMPVILPRPAEALWLDPKTTDPEKILPLLKPYPSDAMEFYPVSRIVNSPKTDTPACIVPRQTPTLDPLVLQIPHVDIV